MRKKRTATEYDSDSNSNDTFKPHQPLRRYTKGSFDEAGSLASVYKKVATVKKKQSK